MNKSRARRGIGRQAAAFLAIATVIGMIAGAPSDGYAATPGKKEFKPGAACHRKTDEFPGVVKMDACHRVYCGRKDVGDIMEIDPNIGERLHCTWVLVGDHCKCRLNKEMTPKP